MSQIGPYMARVVTEALKNHQVLTSDVCTVLADKLRYS